LERGTVKTVPYGDERRAGLSRFRRMKIRQEEMLMAYFDKLNYSKNWENPADFPSYEPSETQVRADLQLLHDEARAALNALVDKLESPGCAANLPVESAQFAAKNLLAALEELLAAAREAQAGTIFPGSVTEEKLAAAVREKLNACDVVYSMNDPTPAENPAAGYPAAKLWLRPPFTVTNLAPDWSFATGGDWTAVHGTASASGGALTLAGTSASRYGELDCFLAAPAGHTVRVYLRATAVAGQMESFTLTVNGAAQALQSGGLARATAVAGADGRVALAVAADWSNTSTAAAASFRLDAFAAVDETALQLAGAAPLTEASLDKIASAALPFHTSARERAVFEQELPGVWTQMIFDALPVSRGGTGKKSFTANRFLLGASGGGLQEKTSEEAVTQLGALRYGEFSYTGDVPADSTVRSRSVQLPVAPKLLLLKNPESSYDVLVLSQGMQSVYTSTWKTSTGGYVSANMTLQLSGSTLSLTLTTSGDRGVFWFYASGTSYKLRYLY
jgi:hypothetical protein